MPSVYVATVIDAPVERVWNLIRDFNALPQWHPLIASSQLEGGLDGGSVGCIRRIELRGSDGALREKLLALSDVDHSCSYSIVEAPIPVKNYLATLRLIPITTTDQTLGQWQATFTVAPHEEAMTEALVRSVFESGLQNLSQILRG